MNFDWDQDQRDFRAAVRAFLEDNLPDNWEELAHGPGSAAQTEFSKQFCGALADAGLLGPHWPTPGPPSSSPRRCGRRGSPGAVSI